MIAHAGVISVLGLAVNTWAQSRSGDMTQTLAVGTFFPFLPEGFVSEFLLALDLFQMWAAVVAGIGLAAADPRRKAGSTGAVLIGLVVVVALLRAAF